MHESETKEEQGRPRRDSMESAFNESNSVYQGIIHSIKLTKSKTELLRILLIYLYSFTYDETRDNNIPCKNEQYSRGFRTSPEGL